MEDTAHVLRLWPLLYLSRQVEKKEFPLEEDYGVQLHKTGKPKTRHKRFGGEKKTYWTDCSRKRGRFEISRFEVFFRL